MRNNKLVSLCITASICSILAGVGLIIAALNRATTAEWGDLAAGFIPQAILIVGGLVALAVCSTRGRDPGGE